MLDADIVQHVRLTATALYAPARRRAVDHFWRIALLPLIRLHLQATSVRRWRTIS